MVVAQLLPVSGRAVATVLVVVVVAVGTEGFVTEVSVVGPTQS